MSLEEVIEMLEKDDFIYWNSVEGKEARRTAISTLRKKKFVRVIYDNKTIVKTDTGTTLMVKSDIAQYVFKDNIKIVLEEE